MAQVINDYGPYFKVQAERAERDKDRMLITLLFIVFTSAFLMVKGYTLAVENMTMRQQIVQLQYENETLKDNLYNY